MIHDTHCTHCNCNNDYGNDYPDDTVYSTIIPYGTRVPGTVYAYRIDPLTYSRYNDMTVGTVVQQYSIQYSVLPTKNNNTLHVVVHFSLFSRDRERDHRSSISVDSTSTVFWCIFFINFILYFDILYFVTTVFFMHMYSTNTQAGLANLAAAGNNHHPRHRPETNRPPKTPQTCLL